MFIKVHSKFILTPLLEVLRDGAAACSTLDDGIESYPLGDYYLQSLFLRMTGAQEQKMKCICWEMATNDYKFRYSYLKGQHSEYSSYSEKNEVYVSMINAIKTLDSSFEPSNLLSQIHLKTTIEQHYKECKAKAMIRLQNEKKVRKGKPKLSSESVGKMMSIFTRKALSDKERFAVLVIGYMDEILEDSMLSSFAEMDLHNFRIHSSELFQEKNIILSETNFFSKTLQDRYTEIVWNHRNRCAHNLTSYQQNLPTLNSLVTPQQRFNNYFFRYAILIMIDEIFRLVYQKYVLVMKNNNLESY